MSLLRHCLLPGAGRLGLVLVVLSMGTVAGAEAQSSPLVREIRPFLPGAGRAEWSPGGDWIAFDKPGGRENYQLWVVKPDGTFERCLTCEPLELRRKNCFNPTWHPSGDWIVFQVQDSPRRLGLDPVELATAHRGLHSELWVISSNGQHFWQLTRIQEQGGAVLDPRFSHEGELVLWSERVRSRVGRWGRWVIRVAQFQGRRGVPRLAKPRTFEPGPLFAAASSFTPDDRGALLSGNLEPGQNENGMDVYRLDFENGSLERLTQSPRAWDEKAQYTVKGDRILWISAGEITRRDLPKEIDLPFEQLRDLWVMKPDGADKQRLTYFNHPTSRESLGAAIVDDFTQSPSGEELLAHVVSGSGGELEEGLWRLRLAEELRR